MDSDERGVNYDPSARPSSPRPDDSAPDPDVASEHSGWVDDKVLSSAVPNDNGRAIDALRAATTAAEAHVPQPTLDDIAQVHRLHDMRVDAEQRSRRPVPKPGARRRFQYALTAETAALRMIGFGSFEAFSAVYGGGTSADNPDAESGETIARIQELLTELGVDPGGDPLRAASEFLTTHEGGTPDLTKMPALEESPRFETAPTPVSEATREPTSRPRPEPAPEPAPAFGADPAIDKIVERSDITELAAVVMPPPVVDSTTTPGTQEPTTFVSFDAPRDEDAPTIAPEATSADAGAGAEDPLPDVEPGAPGMPAAQLSPANPAEIRKNDDVVLDRWIHAEARAERMHAEVDRAQAELVAMLARSADLEQTVVNRADELQAANTALESANNDLESANNELERVRQRVDELEHSIARSDAERPELERALTASRDRVTALETTLSEREQAFTKVALDRASTLESAANLEAALDVRTSQLAEARSAVADLEAELSAQAAHVDNTRAELGAVRANNDQLTAELETTRRALDGLDAHAEAIEAELAEARRAVDNSETRHELEAVRQQLAEARHELGHLEFERAETDRALAHDRIELQQLQHTLATTRDEAIAVLDELTEARRTVDETNAQAEQAERAREAITIDAADLLARAEAEATNVLERANRDAEAIRQHAALESGTSLGASDFRRTNEGVTFGDDTLTSIVARIERLERKLAKQRRRLDRISDTNRPVPEAGAAPGPPPNTARPSAIDELAQHLARPEPGAAEQLSATSIHDSSAAEVIASARREAEAIRQAARNDREQFRAELIALLSRLAPLSDETEIVDDEW
ncbi:MAG: hypothetical protein ACLPVY_04435 [Acidimicrobiia bacterium]